MTVRRTIRAMTCLALTMIPVMLLAQFTTPHVISTPGDVTAVLGSSTVVNHGLVGVGRISASALDSFGESFGSVSGLQITNWNRSADGSYSGTFNILPDRGYNSGNFFSDYAARINQVGFRFTPYTGAAGIGGSTDAEKIAAQNQIVFSTPITGVRLTYDDPIRHTSSITTGLDPAANYMTVFGQTVPYVGTYTGPPSPGAASTIYDVNKLTLDSEALALQRDGSGYVGDEYGANVYYFDSTKRIVGVIVPPAAFQPHFPVGTPNFGSGTTPVNGRRNNQGFEGVSLTPDGKRLFVLLQSAAMQDSDPVANTQLSKNTRLLVYDVSTLATPDVPVGEYALTLPTYKANGDGGAVNRTCAQSEIIALDNTRVLVLSRDGNGLGNSGNNPSVFKSVLLVDLSVGNPTNFADTVVRNVEGGKITTAPGVLDPAIVPLSSIEALNLLNVTQLNRFNIQLDAGTGQVSKLTLGEKWEGLALVYAEDSAHPNDYFLFVGNDNDFLTSNGVIKGPGGLVSYNGFSGYPSARVPPAIGSPNNDNDTLLLAYRLTITPDFTAPAIVPHVAGAAGTNGWYTSSVVVTWTINDPQSGINSSTGCGTTTLVADTAGTTVTCTATNGVGLSGSGAVTVKIDKTPPLISGLPASCGLWPPTHKLVAVAFVTATDALSGLVPASLVVVGSSNEPPGPAGPDIIINPSQTGVGVELRSERLGNRDDRIYSLRAMAMDLAGNTATAIASCVVPHDQRGGGGLGPTRGWLH